MEVIINNVRYVPAEPKDVKGKTLKEKVYNYMLHNEWVTAEEVSLAVNAPILSVDATIRNMRQPKHGGHTVLRVRENGVSSYNLRVV
jgi:hypothetical protein